MDNAELISMFNPKNAVNLGIEELQKLRVLSNEEIGVLAKAYPNHATDTAYLVLHDSKLEENKQLHPRSTWQNLYNLRANSKLSNFTVLTFTELYNKAAKAAKENPLTPVRDLSKAEKVSAPGLIKSAPEQTAGSLKPEESKPLTYEQTIPGEEGDSFPDLSGEAAKLAENKQPPVTGFPPLADPSPLTDANAQTNQTTEPANTEPKTAKPSKSKP